MNQLTMSLSLDGIGHDFGVIGFDGEESLFGDYAFSVYIASPDHTLDLRGFAGTPITLTVEAESLPPRHFSGVVLSATFLGTNPRYAFYCFKMVPGFSLLRMTRCSRVFTNKSVIDIVEAVLDDHGITDRNFLITGSYPKFSHYTQNCTSSFSFLRQIMANDGIFYYYKHGMRSHQMVIQDYGTPFLSCDAQLRHGYSGSDRFRPDEIDSCSLEHRVVPSRLLTIPLHTQDILRRPARSESADPYDLRYEWPKGSAANVDHLEAMGDRRQASFEAAAQVLRGRSYCPSLCAGYGFATTGATRTDLNGTFIVKRVRHMTTPSGYSNEFVAFPASCRYVPLIPADEGSGIDDNPIAPLGELLARARSLHTA